MATPTKDKIENFVVQRNGARRVITLKNINKNKGLSYYVKWRHAGQAVFWLGFVFSPLFNILRVDLTLNKIIFFGQVLPMQAAVYILSAIFSANIFAM
jgi:hypothetical protein